MNENPTKGSLSTFEEFKSHDIEDKLKELDGFLKCPICYDYYRTCVITDCSHSFCSLCIRKSIQFKNECPKCFQELYDSQLRPNRIVDAFVSVLPGLTDCITRRLRTLRTLKPNTLYVSPDKSNDGTPTTKHNVKKRRILTDKEDESPEEEPVAVFIEPEPNDSSKKDTPKVVTIPQIFQSPIKKNANTVPRSTTCPKVQCPICSVDILERNINLHLDKCLERQNDSSGRRNSDHTNRRAYLPKLVVSLMSMSALRAKAKEYGLNSHGDGETLKNRIQRYTVLYNAECDKVDPSPVADIIQQLEKEEKALNQKLPKSIFSAPESGGSKEELAAQYLKENKSHFNELIKNVRSRKTNKKTASSPEATVSDAESSTSSVLYPVLNQPSTSRYIPISSYDTKDEIDSEEIKIEFDVNNQERGNESDDNDSEELFPITRKRSRTQRLNLVESESREDILPQDIHFVGVKNELDDSVFDAFTDEDDDVDESSDDLKSPVFERGTRSKRKADEELGSVNRKSARKRRSVVRKALTERSERKYKQVYDRFMAWRREKGIDSFSEDVMSSYLEQMSDRIAPTSLWSIYSMLKKSILIEHGVDIGEYDELIMCLSEASKSHQPRKGKTFTKRQIEDFISNASDEVYLVEKVACILGLAGVGTRYEFTNLTTDDIVLNSSYLFVNLAEEKTYRQRDFAIAEVAAAILRRYVDLRPEGIAHKRFFINYRKGRCTVHPIGINRIGRIPATIAQFLGLSNPELYSALSFRVKFATLVVPTVPLANLGGRIFDADAKDEPGDLVLP